MIVALSHRAAMSSSRWIAERGQLTKRAIDVSRALQVLRQWRWLQLFSVFFGD
jgi:hypothetical protein